MMLWTRGSRSHSIGFSVLLAAALVTLYASLPAGAQAWIGASGGNWDVAGNWSPGTVPNGSGAVATNSTANTILLNSGSFTVDSFNSTNASANFELFGGSLGWSGSGAGTFGVAGQLNLAGSSTLSGFVVTAGGGAVLGVSQTTTLDGITFAGGTNYTAQLNSTTVVNGTLTNTGNFQINGGSGNNTQLVLGSATALNGAGTVTLNTTVAGGNNAIIEGNGQTLTNNSTIQGNGIIGNGSLAVVNAGTINANVSGDALTLNGSGGITNTGTIEASNGGVLNLLSTTINNAGGIITTNGSGDIVQIFGSTTIQGGTLNNTASGAFMGTPVSQTAVLDGVTHGAITIDGAYTGQLNSTTQIAGTINNTGNIIIQGGNGNNTQLEAVNIGGVPNIVLQGGGSVTLSTIAANGNHAIIELGSGGVTLTNVNNTIQGDGIIGNNGLVFVNQALGTVNANYSSGPNSSVLTMQSFGGPTINQGLFEATNNGVLNINGGTVNNQGGTITAIGSGAIVQLFGSVTVQGGTLNNNGGAFFGTPGSSTAFLDGSTGSGAINSFGTYTGALNSTTQIAGTIINNGSFVINGGSGNNTQIEVVGPVTLQGGGSIVLSTVASGGDNAILEQGVGGSTLTNVNNTIEGNGIIGNNSLALINASGGTINANYTSGPNSAVLTLQSLGGITQNQGLIEATNNGVLNINGGTYNNAGGTITAVGSGAEVVFQGSATIQGGTLNNNGGAFLGTAGSQTAILDGSTSGPITIDGTYTAALNSTTVVTGSIIQNGIIQINGGSGNNTQVEVDGSTTLSGTGGITLSTASGGDNAILEQGVGGSTLFNPLTIQGNGIIGNNGLTLVNSGTVDANVAGSALLMVSTAVTNTGVLEASNGGVLQINGITVNNNGGLITTNTSSDIIQFFGGTIIQGGTLTNTAGGFLGTAGSLAATLDGSTQGPLTINGQYTASPNSSTTVFGTFNNNGNIQLNGGGGVNTNLLVQAGLTLQNGGTLTLSTVTGGNNALIEQSQAGSILTNVNNTIQGEGIIGNNGLTLINESAGVVDANSTGAGGSTTTLALQSLSLTNQGLVEATNSGVLNMNGIVVNNQGGTIEAVGGGAIVQIFGSSTIQGGTLDNNGGAFFGTPISQTATLDGSTGAGPVTIEGTYTAARNSTTNLAGTINNTGTLFVDGGGGNNTNIVTQGNVLLTGGGTLTLSTAPGGNNGLIEQASAGLVLENVNNTIDGNGVFGVNGLSLLNDAAGTVHADVSGSTLLFNGGGSVTNNGTFNVDAGAALHLSNVTLTNFSGNTLTGGTYIVNGTNALTGQLQINSLGTTGGEIVNNAATIILNGPNSNFVDAAGLDALSKLAANTTADSNLTITAGRNLTTPGDFSNAGTVWIGTGSTLQIGSTGTNNYIQSGGKTTVNGILDPTSVELNGGILAGTGTVVGNVIGSAGTIAPGEATSTGALTINGNLNDTGSTLNIRLGGVSAGAFDVLDVTGTANLGAGSVMDLSLFNGFNPTDGETFTFLDFLSGGLTSQGLPDFFGTVNGLTTPGGTFSIAETNNDGLTLTFTANTPPPPPPPSNGTPEPAPTVMLGSGLAAWMLLRRRIKLQRVASNG